MMPECRHPVLLSDNALQSNRKKNPVFTEINQDWFCTELSQCYFEF